MATRLLALLLLIRLLNALTLRTFFQPDEFFQSLEPAWALAFGPDSGAWLTWEWRHQLRSSLHPLLFAAWYKLADALAGLITATTGAGEGSRAEILVVAPRVLQAGIAAAGDWYTFVLARRLYGVGSMASWAALALQVASPWQWYVSTRTFSNSLETTLTVMALASYPWALLRQPAAVAPVKENPKTRRRAIPSLGRLRDSLSLAALAVVLRPTNILIWAPIALVTLSRCAVPDRLVFAREAVFCGVSVLAMAALADKWYFGAWAFPPWEWLTFNLSRSLAVFYGRNPWHYYLLQGLPLLCTTSLVFVLQALREPLPPGRDERLVLRTLTLAVFVTVGTLSLISHKEVRFIYPLLPILNVLAAPYASSFFTSTTTTASSTGSTASSSSRPRSRLANKPFLVAALALNAVLAGYLSLSHQSAPLTVLSFLRTEYARSQPLSTASSPVSGNGGGGGELFALFLTPCHSTPWRSHLVHPALRAYALSCEPPLHTLPGTPERDLYRDEADRFYDDPLGFLVGELFAPQSGLPQAPRFVVGFEGIERWLLAFAGTERARELGWTEVKRVWETGNGLFNEDWRRSGKMVVWDTGRSAS